MKKIIIIIILAFSLSLTACAKSAENSYTGNTEAKPQENHDSGVADDSVEAPMELPAEESGAIYQGERKIISKAEVYIETLEFEKATEKLSTYVDEVKGYTEASNVYEGRINQEYKDSRWGEYTIRVPKESFKKFLNDLKDVGNITNTNSSGEDVSSEYYDSETRVQVLKAQEKRYLELLSETQSMEDILKIEEKLTEVRYEIERLTGYLKKIDGLVDYGTVTVRLEEVLKTTVLEKTPTTLGGKIGRAFSNSIETMKSLAEGILLFVVVLIPYLIIILLLASLGFFIYKTIEKRKKSKVK